MKIIVQMKYRAFFKQKMIKIDGRHLLPNVGRPPLIICFWKDATASYSYMVHIHIQKYNRSVCSKKF